VLARYLQSRGVTGSSAGVVGDLGARLNGLAPFFLANLALYLVKPLGPKGFDKAFEYEAENGNGCRKKDGRGNTLKMHEFPNATNILPANSILCPPPSKWDRLHSSVRQALFLFRVLCASLLALLWASYLSEQVGWQDAAARRRCDAFVSEGFETETRWSKQVGCMVRRADGWERL